MISGFKAKLFHIEKNWLYFRNETQLFQVYSYKPDSFLENNEYWIFTVLFKQIGYKNIEKSVLFGFESLDESIYFEELISIENIGLKTGFKILRNGVWDFKRFVDTNDSMSLKEKFNLNDKQINSIFKYYHSALRVDLTLKETNYLKEVINQLEELGYSKKVSEWVVYKNQSKLLKNPNSDFLSYLVIDIQNAKI